MGRITRNEIINGETINLESRRPCVMDIRGRCLDAAFSCGPGCVTLSLSLRLSSRTDDPPAVIAAHVTNCATPQSGTVPEPYQIIDEDNRNRNHEPAIMLYLEGTGKSIVARLTGSNEVLAMHTQVSSIQRKNWQKIHTAMSDVPDQAPTSTTDLDARSAHPRHRLRRLYYRDH